jgi:hypothetical protein
MEHGEPDVEETVVVQRDDADLDRTIVRPSRRARAAAVEDTIVVDRDAEAVEDTVVVDRSADAVEETIVVDRGADAVEETIVVDRGADAERTIMVDRRPKLLGADPDDDDDTDRTVARPRDDIVDDDETITVDRSAASVPLPPVPSLRPARVQRRRGIAPPPIPAGFAPAARAAVGPGAVEHYRPRELSAPPVAPTAPEGDAVTTRVIDPALPSVARRARRTAVVAVAAFAGACVVSVTGLTLILLWVL